MKPWQIAGATIWAGIPNIMIYETNCGSIGLIGSDVIIPVVKFYNRITILRDYQNKGQSQTLPQFQSSVARHTSDADEALDALRLYLSEGATTK